MRKPNWPKLLNQAIEPYLAGAPFEWGKHDCYMLADQSVEAITGKRILAGIKYTSNITGARRLKKLGAKTVEDVFASRFDRIAPALAKRGDIGVVDCNETVAAGVFTALGFMTFGPKSGVVFMSFDQVKSAFKVD